MEVQRNLKSSIDKYLYKIVLYLIKTIPIITAILTLLNIILSYFYIDLEIFSHICGVSLFTILFMYMSMYYGVEEDSEEAAYLTGFIAQKMHRCFRHFIYTGVK